MWNLYLVSHQSKRRMLLVYVRTDKLGFFPLIQWENEEKVESRTVYVRGQPEFGRTLIRTSRHQRSHRFKAFFFYIMILVLNIKMWERKINGQNIFVIVTSSGLSF